MKHRPEKIQRPGPNRGDFAEPSCDPEPTQRDTRSEQKAAFRQPGAVRQRVQENERNQGRTK